MLLNQMVDKAMFAAVKVKITIITLPEFNAMLAYYFI
jgi:hypothetical protein